MRPESPVPCAFPKDDNRLTIHVEIVPEWARNGGSAFCVPLIWRRGIELPAGHELEAWYLWSGQKGQDEWVVNPQCLLDVATVSGAAFHQAALIYEASIEAADRKYRLSCAGLFAWLRKRTSAFWFAVEPDSVSLWTDYAFQAWHGKIARETD